MTLAARVSPGPAEASPGAAVATGVIVGEETPELPIGTSAEGGVHAALDGPSLRVVAGLGRADEVDADAVRTAAGAAAREALRWGVTELRWTCRADLPVPADEQAKAAAEGVVLGTYDAGRWQRDDGRAVIERLVLCGDVPAEVAGLEQTLSTAAWANECRTLVNAGGNEVTPQSLAADARRLAERFPTVSASTLDRADLEAAGMGAILAVASGSDLPPAIITVRHTPPNAVPGVRLALVGKAVTFDAGGLNLKLTPKLHLEKSDMAGGAAVLCAVGAIAEAGIPVEVVGVLAACENMSGGSAYRPGDIVTAGDGTTIEVLNTDAEGRLALADAMIHARSLGPTHLVDIATLTGATIDALGHVYGCVFPNDADLGDKLMAASASSGDRLWPWPMHRAYRPLLRSAFADLRNYSGDRTAQPVFGAMFVGEFAGDLPWAHVDICGPSNLERPGNDCFAVEGGTGFGVRLLVDLARQFATAVDRG